MAVNVHDKIKKLSRPQRKKVEARAAELLAEEMTLRELRKARKLTQVRIAKALGITQDSVSRLEQRSDYLLSTLPKAVKAMGGQSVVRGRVPGPRAGGAGRHRRGEFALSRNGGVSVARDSSRSGELQFAVQIEQNDAAIPPPDSHH